MTWPTKKLGEIISIIESGKRPKGGAVSSGIPSIGVEHISDSNGFKLDGLKYIPEGFYESLNKGKLNRDDILIAKDGATTGKTVFLSDDFPFSKAAVNEHIFILRGKNEIVGQKFLFYILYSPQGQKQLLKTKHGAAQGGIDQSFVNFVKIPLPPVAIQKQIVERLDKIAVAQKLNDELIQKSDELFQSLLHKVLDSDNKTWEVKKLGEVAEVKGGKRIPKGMNFSSESTSHPYLRVVDFMDGSIKIEKLKYINDGIFKFIKNYTISPRDIYISIAGTIGLVGKVPEILDGASLTENAAKILVDESKIDQDYLIFALSTIQSKKQIKKFTQAVGVPKLALERIKKIQIPIPSIEKQKRIVEKLSAAQEYKKQLLAQKSLLKELFDSVLHKSMKGEMD